MKTFLSVILGLLGLVFIIIAFWKMPYLLLLGVGSAFIQIAIDLWRE